MTRLSVEHTLDEFKSDRYFVADERADWIAGPFDTEEEATAEIDRRTQRRRDAEAEAVAQVHAQERRFCRECGAPLTAQEGSMCSPCYRLLTEPES